MSCLPFLLGLSGGFIFDDGPNITSNPSLIVPRLDIENLLYAAYSFQPGHGSRPLAMLSFALDYWRAGGMDPVAFKTTNLVIHGLTVLVLAGFLRQLLALAGWPLRRAALTALVLAAAWAVHPLQVSSVLYVVQRMQTLCTLFVLAALWAYLAMRQAQLAGLRSRQYGLLGVLLGLLALASKEDAALLPLYLLILELTVLGFRAASPRLATGLRRGYAVSAALGVAVYVLWVVPHYWSWGAYPGRDFSSLERLLTQGRVLAMYLGQVLLPLPSRLPFFYDDLAVSRSLWQPATTLPALALVFGLLGWAWAWRKRHPVFAFGLLFFFAGHFMTSNVIGLELAFEHRNQLPLVGALLALADLWQMAAQRLRLRPAWSVVLAACVLSGLAVCTGVRAYAWGDPLRLAAHNLRHAPLSARAWTALGSVYVQRSGLKPGYWLDRVVDVNETGARLTNGPSLLANLVTFKTIQGTVTQADWDRLLQRLQEVPMNAQTQNIVWVFLNNLDRGIPLDEDNVIQVFDIISSRSTLQPYWYLRIGAYLHNDTHQPGKALPYLRRAVELTPEGDGNISSMLLMLQAVGREDWVHELEALPRPPAR